MKRAWITMAAALLLLAGCESKSGGGDAAPGGTSGANEQPLTIGEETVIQAGEDLVPTSEDARVKLVFGLDANRSSVTLLKGGAKIVSP